mmetsp:Transcript_20640/g.45531  ORF Transcript_20640/g.45531 Transcript_20640/m.45531 type:complete len:238 (+) Transcript_20640:407-1120(+)
MLRADDQDAEHLAVGAAALAHVVLDVLVVVLGRLVVDLEDLVDHDDRARGADLHRRERKHAARLRLHADGHPADHAHRAGGVVRPLDGDGHAEAHHAVELQRALRLLERSHLAEAVVGALVARKPDVEHGVLVRIVAHAAVPHGLVELLREGVLGDAEVVREVAQVEAAILPRRVGVVGVDAGVGAGDPLEAVPEHALTRRRCARGAPSGSRFVLVRERRLLLSAPLLALAALVRGL